MNVYTPLLTFILCLKSVKIKFNNNNNYRIKQLSIFYSVNINYKVY